MEMILEKEKNELLEIAEDKFGKVYFERLRKQVEDYNLKMNNQKRHFLTIKNHEGAFCASEK